MANLDFDRNVQIKEVFISGIHFVRLKYFKSILRESLESHNLHEIRYNLESVQQQLLNSNLFDDVLTVIDVNESLDNCYIATLRMEVKEKGRPFIKAESYIKAGSSPDAGMELYTALRNPLSVGDILSASTCYSHSGSNEITTQYHLPYLSSVITLPTYIKKIAPHDGQLNIALKLGSDNRYNQTSSFGQNVKSLICNLETLSGHQKLISEFSIRDEIPKLASKPNEALSTDTILRSFFNRTIDSSRDRSSSAEIKSTRQASSTIFADCAKSVKSSIKFDYTLIDDTKKDNSDGNLLATSIEVALPTAFVENAAQFVKSDISTQIHREIGPRLFNQTGLTLSFLGSVGFILPYKLRYLSLPNFELKPISLSDRYYLGGPLLFRGFAPSGVGPRAFSQELLSNGFVQDNDTESSSNAMGDSLGGNLKSLGLLALSAPVPFAFPAENKIRAFAFINGGSVGCLTRYESYRKRGDFPTAPLFGYLRLSLGWGFTAILLNQVRMELTYSVPVLRAIHDNTKNFQIGLGLHWE